MALRLASVVVFLSLLAVSAAARAQDPSVPFSPEDKRGAAWVEVGGYGRGGPDVNATTVDFTLGGGYRVLPELNLRAIVPMMFGSGHAVGLGAASDSALDSGNPMLLAEWMHDFDAVRVRAGGGLTIPLAPYQVTLTHFADPFLELYATGLHGVVDSWLYVPETFSIVGHGHVETRRPIAGFLLLAGDLAMAVLVPTGDTGGRHAHFVMQYGVTVGVQIIRELSAGLRFYLAHDPTDGGFYGTFGSNDAAQTSLSPYVRAEVGPAFFDLSLAMNLDDNLGFAFDSGKIWGLRLAGGARF